MQKKVKILVLSHVNDLVGGAERSLLDILDLWHKNYKIEVEIIFRRSKGTFVEAIKQRNWRYHAVDYTFWSHGEPLTKPEEIFAENIINNQAVLSIEKIIKESKPDFVLTNTIVSPWAALAAHYQNVPHVWFVREYGDLDHGRVFAIGRKETFEDIGALSCIVATNSKALQSYVEQFIPSNKITTVYTPFDLDEIDKKLSESISNPFKFNDSLKLVVAGSITPSKGQSDIVKAIVELKKEDIRVEVCIIGGNGPREYKEEITRIIKKNKIQDQVHFVGHQNNPLAFVALADVGIMASRQEAFGRVTFEYIAAGKPVVGANSGGTTEMVLNGKNGFLFKPQNTKELTDKIRIYAKNRDLISKHGKYSRKHAKAMMDGKNNAIELFESIKKEIKNKKDNVIGINKLNYSHKLIEFNAEAGKTIISVKRLMVKRIKQRAAIPLRKAKAVKHRLVN